VVVVVDVVVASVVVVVARSVVVVSATVAVAVVCGAVVAVARVGGASERLVADDSARCPEHAVTKTAAIDQATTSRARPLTIRPDHTKSVVTPPSTRAVERRQSQRVTTRNAH
jgi:hypothetical protein